MTSGRILVLEDDPGLRATLCELLRDEGYVVDAFADGLDALASLETEPLPRLVLLDLMLANVDGFEFRAKQLALPKAAKIPVIVISGASDIAAISAALRAAGYLRKPFDAEKLLDTVARFWDQTTPGVPLQ